MKEQAYNNSEKRMRINDSKRKQNELLTGAISEDKIANIWPDYPCLYDVNFKNRDMREKAFLFLFYSLNKICMRPLCFSSHYPVP